MWLHVFPWAHCYWNCLEWRYFAIAILRNLSSPKRKYVASLINVYFCFLLYGQNFFRHCMSGKNGELAKGFNFCCHGYRTILRICSNFFCVFMFSVFPFELPICTIWLFVFHRLLSFCTRAYGFTTCNGDVVFLTFIFPLTTETDRISNDRLSFIADFVVQRLYFYFPNLVGYQISQLFNTIFLII